jgi:hypothetical protein
VSKVIDAAFSARERDKLLAEVREHLPAFLHRGATEQHDPVGDVRELLNLEKEDLSRVISVHECLASDVQAFGAALRDDLRRPITASVRPPEPSQSVRGPVDWGATVSRRALEAANPFLFVVRPAQRLFDTPENRALAWLLEELRAATSVALSGSSGFGESAEPSPYDRDGWSERIELLRARLEEARRVYWLRGVRAEAPTTMTLKRLRAARQEFYAVRLAAALEVALRLANPSAEVLTEILAQRYFRPERTWLLFELAIALRLARAFAAQSPQRRKTRLLVGGGRSSFARYDFGDAGELALFYQAWPRGSGQSIRRDTGDRHGLRRSSSRPDIVIVGTGRLSDAVVLELKATYSSGYLGSGLSQLLGYLAEWPDLWTRQPAGWLVAPASEAFQDRPAVLNEPLWMLSAERIGRAAVERFLGSATAAAVSRPSRRARGSRRGG